jgi:hypothetical protein
VLGLDREPDCLLLVQVVALPEPLEEVEAKLTAQRSLDDLAIALTGARAEGCAPRRVGLDCREVVERSPRDLLQSTEEVTGRIRLPARHQGANGVSVELASDVQLSTEGVT